MYACRTTPILFADAPRAVPTIVEVAKTAQHGGFLLAGAPGYYARFSPSVRRVCVPTCRGSGSGGRDAADSRKVLVLFRVYCEACWNAVSAELFGRTGGHPQEVVVRCVAGHVLPRSSFNIVRGHCVGIEDGVDLVPPPTLALFKVRVPVVTSPSALFPSANCWCV
jgi:hypothetical protein